MTTLQIVFVAALCAGLLIGLVVVGLWQHKRAAGGELNLMGAIASVETTLEPEGSVLVGGELWRARIRSGESVERGQMVRVVGASRHLLEVEPVRAGALQN